ncbi:calcium-binding protein [Azospirillum sp.]|uniref:calcium-binding protein n=1 Tax=Azospirillum sp. TaxID=34012 RepID=UPI002D2A301A|nr:calcium-binding protein [Azospirillum sp.]HYD71302.1 calcium-binding protein [Azospirillum sp.]
MARLFASVAVNLSGEGNLTGVVFDNFTVTASTPTVLSYHYTYGAHDVMDVAIGGSLSYSASNIWGSVNSFVATAPGGGAMVSIDFLDLSFSSVYEMSYKLINSYMFRNADVMVGSAYADTLVGRGGGDVMQGMGGADTLRGGDDGDQMYGNLGADQMSGDAGGDWMFGGQDSDWLEGGSGDDLMQGNMANDTLVGGDGADALFGGQGDDVLNGGLGNDTLNGNLGNDTLIGDTGADRFVFRAGQGNDTVYDFAGASGDRIELAAGTAYTVATATEGAAIVLATGETLTLKGVTAAQVVEGWVVFA